MVVIVEVRRSPRPIEEVIKDMEEKKTEFLDRLNDIQSCIRRALSRKDDDDSH